TRVIGIASPPAARMRYKEDTTRGAKIIVPFAFHDPPSPLAGVANTCGTPPEISIRFSARSAKKPRARLSGDQKGKLAPSVPGIGRAAVESKARTKSMDLSC